MSTDAPKCSCSDNGLAMLLVIPNHGAINHLWEARENRSPGVPDGAARDASNVGKPVKDGTDSAYLPEAFYTLVRVMLIALSIIQATTAYTAMATNVKTSNCDTP